MVGPGHVSQRPIVALATLDEGTGAAFCACGDRALAGGVPVSSLARREGTSWSAVGASPDGVNALAVFDAGPGPRLYAAVSSSGGLYGWDGASWELLAALGDPITPGSTRWYQTYCTYCRDPNVCPAPSGDGFNVNSGLRIVW
jgi:hypothetical protein